MGIYTLTASQLFSPSKPGPHLCYYCGFPCGEDHRAKDHVKATFTNRDEVAQPGSDYVCGGCVASMQTGIDFRLVDGEIVEANNRIGPRLFSWVIESGKKTAFKKSHMEQLRNAVLDPPDPPFCIVLADSGKKQLIFRAPVSMGREYFRVMLEEEIINVRRDRLIRRLNLAKQLIAAIGKPALADWDSVSHGIRVFEYFGSLDLLNKWAAVKHEPLSRLALWLAPPMEACRNEYAKAEHRRIPSVTGRVDGPGNPQRGQGGEKGCQGPLRQASFDFG